jgi:hypothetical protein
MSHVTDLLRIQHLVRPSPFRVSLPICTIHATLVADSMQMLLLKAPNGQQKDTTPEANTEIKIGEDKTRLTPDAKAAT